MPRINVTDKVPSLYLESFKPAPGSSTRISVLDTSPFCTLGHWITDQVHGVQGRYECQGSAVGGTAPCCEAFPLGTPGAAGFQFSVPVWVYTDPLKDVSGSFMGWNMTQNFYKNNFQRIAQTNDLSQYDIEVTARQQGQGVQLAATVVTSVQMRMYWTEEVKAEIASQLAKFMSMGDANFVKVMTAETWTSLLLTMGYDFVNHCFPVGFGAQAKFGGTNIPQSLAALNQPGYLPSVNAYQPQQQLQPQFQPPQQPPPQLQPQLQPQAPLVSQQVPQQVAVPQVQAVVPTYAAPAQQAPAVPQAPVITQTAVPPQTAQAAVQPQAPAMAQAAVPPLTAQVTPQQVLQQAPQQVLQQPAAQPQVTLGVPPQAPPVPQAAAPQIPAVPQAPLPQVPQQQVPQQPVPQQPVPQPQAPVGNAISESELAAILDL